MIYDEALTYKESLPQSKVYEDITFRPFIVPSDIEQKTLYTNYVYSQNYSVQDSDVLKFSKENDFVIRWIGYYPVRNTLIYKDDL